MMHGNGEGVARNWPSENISAKRLGDGGSGRESPSATDFERLYFFPRAT
jgi:hypothetical protein